VCDWRIRPETCWQGGFEEGVDEAVDVVRCLIQWKYEDKAHI